MDKFLKGIGKGLKKIGQSYKRISSKDSRIDTVLTMTGVLLFSFIVLFVCQKGLGEKTVTIADNKAEGSFYEGDYETAIKEYEKQQEKNEWPMDTVKLAEIYSIQGEYGKSNRLLESAYETRNELIDKNGRSKYVEDDGELGSKIAFTSFMNGDYNKALQYGEMFIEQNSSSKSLEKTMVALHMANNQKDKAKMIVDKYNVDNESSYDLAVYAEMNMIVDNWENGFKALKEAWYKNKDEIKVYDVIAQITENNKNDTIKKIKELSQKDKDEVCYKVWLLESYSILEGNTSDASKIIEEIKDEDLGDIVFNSIKAKIYNQLGNKEEAKAIINEVLKNTEDSYVGYYVAAKYYLDEGNTNKAYELCKKSILANKAYPNNYGVLIPEIMIKNKQSENAESYYRVALSKEPFNYNMMLKVANYYLNTASNNIKAYDYFNLASLINAKDAKTYYNMALIKIAEGKIDEGVELVNKCIAIDNTTSKYHRALGKIYLDAGKNKEAIAEIREAYTIDKNDALNLNNAGIYYMTVEKDRDRGMENLKSAYEKISNLNDAEEKNTISENYLNAKEYYDSYKKNDGSTIVVPVFKTIY